MTQEQQLQARLNDIQHNTRNPVIGARCEIVRIMAALRSQDMATSISAALRLEGHFERIEAALSDGASA